MQAHVQTKSGRPLAGAPKSRSISDLLTMLALSILVPLLAFSALVLWRVIEVEQSRAEQAATIAADTLSRDIERDLRAVAATLLGLATSPALQTRDYSTFYAQAAAVQQLLNAPILLRDFRTGEQVVNTRLKFGDQLPKIIPSDMDDVIKVTREPYVSDLVYGTVAKRLLLAVGVPVIVNGEVTGTLVASIEPERFIRIMNEQANADTWTFAVTDRNAAIVARSRDQAKYLGAFSPIVATSTVPEGVHRVRNLDGNEVLRGFRRIKEGWTIAASTSVNAIDTPVQKSWLTFALAGGLAFAFALPVTLRFARRIAQSIRTVATIASALERGEAAPLAMSHVSEVNEVTSIIHTASVHLRERTRSLAESAARFKSAFEQAAVGFEQTDLDHKWLSLNNRFSEMLGYSREECEKLSPADVCHPDDYASEVPARAALLRGDTPSFTTEKRYFKKDGSILRARSTSSLVSDVDGKPLYYISVVEDVTAGYSARAAMARLAALVQASNDAILSVTPEGIVETWNPGAERLFGYQSEDITGKSAAILAPKDHQSVILGLLDRGAQGEPFRQEAVLQRKDGTAIDVAIGVSPIYDRDDTVSALSVTVEDIRDRRLWENQLILLNRELQHRVKNTLAVVQSIANQTLRFSTTPASFHAAFLGRLQSLAAANDLLLQTTWTGGDLNAIIERQIKPLLSSPLSQLRRSGPTVALPGELTVPLGLALHELGTNALKYGSLSVAGGAVHIDWDVENIDGKRLLRLTWSEHGGPPAKPPSRKGFGSTLINRGVPGATVRQQFTGGGLVCTFEILLSQVAGTADKGI